MLRLPPLKLVRPTSVEEAVAALGGSPAAVPLAGGTDLLVALKQGHVPSPGSEPTLVSLGALPLADVEHRAQGWSLGAGLTLWDLARWEAGRRDPALTALVEAAGQVAAPPIRSAATVGGNLCLDTRCVFFNQSAFWRSGRPACRKAGGEVCHVAPGADRCFACQQADLAPVAVALGARVAVAGQEGLRDVPAEALYSGEGARPLRLARGDLLLSVAVPDSGPGTGAAFQKLRLRKGLDFAAASAAVWLKEEGGRCVDVRIVLGSLGSGPVRAGEAEEALRGTKLEEEALSAAASAARSAARPVKNADLTPAYRREVAGVLVARAARSAWARALGRSS